MSMNPVILLSLIYIGNILDLYYRQNDKITELKYKCRTFGDALGILGGQISIIMSVLSMLMGWYS
jgi:hypothetical protein